MFFRSGPSVTKEDKEWVEDCFLWFEEEYGKDFLKSVPFVTPTKKFFPIEFKGTETNASEILKIMCDHLYLDHTTIILEYFSDERIELADGIFSEADRRFPGGSKNATGTYSYAGKNKHRIELERNLLSTVEPLIATLAHELSHVMLLGEGRTKINEEHLTDLNCIATGYGIFLANNLFKFESWKSVSHMGWSTKRSGYVPEEVATYALALLANYQQSDTGWTSFLKPELRKMFDRNMKYLRTTKDEIKFR